MQRHTKKFCRHKKSSKGGEISYHACFCLPGLISSVADCVFPGRGVGHVCSVVSVVDVVVVKGVVVLANVVVIVDLTEIQV